MGLIALWMADGSQARHTNSQRNFCTLGLPIALQGGIHGLSFFEPWPYNRNVLLSNFCLNINFSFDIIHMSEYDFMLEYYFGRSQSQNSNLIGYFSIKGLYVSCQSIKRDSI